MQYENLNKLVREARSLNSAAALYKRLGLYLSGRDDRGLEPKPPFPVKDFRVQVIEARRRLERRWGQGVRFEDLRFSEQPRTLRGQFGRRTFERPVWQERKHFTVKKPPIGDPPHLMFVTYDPITREPVGTFFKTAQKPFALRDALARLEEVMEARALRRSTESIAQFEARLLEQKIDQLTGLLVQLKPFAEEVELLEEYLKELQKQRGRAREEARRPSERVRPTKD